VLTHKNGNKTYHALVNRNSKHRKGCKMNNFRKTYVEFYYSGTFFGERSIQRVNTRDISKLEVPKNAFGFKFLDILFGVWWTNVSLMYYYGGKLYTPAEVKREFPYDSSIIRNIENHGFTKVIHCPTGNWQQFRETDILVEPSPE
jgi:hypothetical protein